MLLLVHVILLPLLLVKYSFLLLLLQAQCERALSLGRDARSFLVAAVSPLLSLYPPLPRVRAEGAFAAWGAPEAPEALSPLHSPLRNADSPWRDCSPQRRLSVADKSMQQQKQQQQQQEEGEGGLGLCAEAVKSIGVRKHGPFDICKATQVHLLLHT